MSTTSIKDKKFTQKLMSSPRTALFIAGLLALVVDTAAMIAFATLGVKLVLGYIILSLMLVLDAIFLFEILLSNFRLPYAKHSFIGHTALLVLLTAGNVWLCTLIANGQIFTTMAIIAWVAVHLAICVGYIICVVRASRGQTGTGTISMVAALVVVVATVAYSSLLISMGFFGQGAPPRTLVYALDEETGTYTVTGVLDGRGTEVIVPTSFNGAPVTGIDCSIFGADGVAVVTIEADSEGLQLVNVEAVSGINHDLVMKVHKNNATALRDKLYSLAGSFTNKDSIFELANRLVPCGLESDEVFVTFGYTATTYEMVDGHTLPIWIAKEGTSFDPSIYTGDLAYATHADYTSGADLKWCVFNMDGYQFNGFVADGKTLVGTELYNSMGAIGVSFNKVYTLQVAEDNDTLYTLPESFTNSLLDGGEYDSNYRYVTLKGANEYLASAPNRAGFYMVWKNSTGEFADLASFLESSANHLSPITITPVWTLNNPEIGNLVITGSEGNNLVYGHDVTLTTEGVNHSAEVSYKYQWLSESGDVLVESDTLSMTNVLPSQSGIYTLRVEAYSNTLTSLTAVSTKQVAVNIAKRNINFIWSLPSNLVYSATDKAISAEHDALDVINSDAITFNLKCNTIHNAGTYNAVLELTGDAADKYAIASEDVARTVVITPYETQVQWSDMITTYNGSAQKPTVTATALGGDVLDIILSREATNAGTYAILASTSNPNYTLTNTEGTFYIEKKLISATWDGASHLFTYDGASHNSILSDVTDEVDGEETLILNSIIYTGSEKNAGSYTTVASLPADSNYKFATDTIEHAYTIEKRVVTPVWGNTSFVYNGQEQKATIVDLNNCVAGELNTILGGITYTGDRKDHGSSTAVATMGNSNYRFETDTVSQAFTIEKKAVTPKWSGTSFVYNGASQSISVESLVGVIAGEEASALLDLEYANASNKNAGTYEAIVTLKDNSNYCFETAQTKSYTIAKKTISASWSELGLTYNGGTQTITVTTLSGCVDGEASDVLSSITLSGNEEKNAGSYTATATLPESSNYCFVGGGTFVTANYTIAKYVLSPVWSENSFIYDGTEKSVVVTGFENCVAGEESAVLSSLIYTNHVGTNAGSFTASISLPTASNYSLASNQCTGTIAKRVLTPVWGTTDFIYDGSHTRVVLDSVGNCVSGEEDAVLASIIYSGNQQKNAGTYTATATLPASSNYVFENAVSTSYAIEKRVISINWENNTFIYNGSQQYQKVESLNNCVSGEEATILNSILYAGKEKNAGTYTVSASLPTNSNYVFEGATTTSYTIEKKEVTAPVWSNTNLTYNGKEQVVTITGMTGCINSSEKTALLNSLIYSGNSAKNAGTYTAYAEIPSDSNYFFSGALTVDFTIAKKELTANWSTVPFTYDGTEKTYLITSLSGVQTGDDKNAILDAILYTDHQATLAGTYTAKAELPDDSNYVLKASTTSKTFEIKKAKLNISLKTSSFIYDGTTHTVEVNMTGYAIGEETAVLNSLIFANESQTNAGSYNVTISISEDGNYDFGTGIYSKTLSYTISKRTITATWNEETRTIEALSNCVAGEEAEVLAGITYSGNTETEEGTHTATATLPANSNYQFASGSSTTFSYTIDPVVEPDTDEEV